MRSDTTKSGKPISSTLLQEARGIVMSSRVAELSELILYVLSMPDEILEANAVKFRPYDKRTL